MKWTCLSIILLVELAISYSQLDRSSYSQRAVYDSDFSVQNPFSNYDLQEPKSSYAGVKSGVKSKSKWSGGVKTKSYSKQNPTNVEPQHNMVACTPSSPLITNANVKCQEGSCEASCLNGYQFSNGETIAYLRCVNTEWRINNVDMAEMKSCEPICMPFCENNGICIVPGMCECPENYFGSRCQDRKQLCLSKPQIPKNSKASCNSGSCTITCAKGFKFPDGTSITNLKCLNGKWVPNRQDLDQVPDCQPTCDPPCKNGGRCLSYNVCQCLSAFRGPQCQYNIDRCSPKKMGFNGGYNCSGQNNQISCQIYCPRNVDFQYQPAKLYTCMYSKGYFEPKKIPHCVYSDDMQIIPLGESQKTFQHSIKHHYDIQEPQEEDGSWEKVIARTIMKIKKKKSKNLEEYDSGDPYEVPGTHSLYLSSGLDLEMRTPKPELCSTWGGDHLKTFDGLVYRTPLYCGHTLIKDYIDGTFNIILKACPYGSPEGCPHSLQIFLQNIVYTFQNEDGIIALYTPKKRLPIPVQVIGMKVVPVAQSLKIDLEAIGVVINWDSKQHITIEASAGLWNRTAGLCGTLDMKYQNDFMSKDGTILTTPKSFADSWKIKSDDDPNNCIMEEMTTDRECTLEMEQNATKICTKLLSNDKLQNCFKAFAKNALTEICIEDYCNCPDRENPASCTCNAMSVLAKECHFREVRLDRGWRNLNICPVKCNTGRVYLPCGPTTEPTCGSAVLQGGTEVCNEGCFCPEGTVQHNSNCIPIELCPCRLRNKEFKAGSTIQKDCNTCTCENGVWSCTDISCGARCGAIGDPHYVTFDGKRYDFMGKCSYYLMKTNNFSIEAENIACPGSISAAMSFSPTISIDMPSCTKSITIKFELDGKETAIKLRQGRLVFINDKEVTKFPKTIGNGLLVLRQASSTMLSVDFADGIRLWWDGMTRVYIDAPPSYRDKTEGLCGTFNSNIQDDFLTPEGDIESTTESFANKWRTKDTCDYISETASTPHPCQVNFENREKAEKYCAKLTDEIFESCHWSVDPAPYYEDCMYDVCACKGDPVSCFCPILASYGSECSRQGITTNWRYSVKECAIKCPVGQIYDECGDSCIRSCEDISTKAICRGHCIEGCRCPTGQYLNDRNECIPESSCPCVYEDSTFEPGFKEVRPGQHFLELCTCKGGSWECDVASTRDRDLYPPASEMRSKCANKAFAEFSHCLPKEPKSCKNMHKYSEEFDDCKPGCTCMDGYVLDTSVHSCVLPQNCSCHHGGRSYNDGDEIKEECSNCKCKSGKWNCLNVKCASTCSVWGDSHFTTFDKKEFDFQGACDYILSKGVLPGGDGFSITIQNVLCGTMGVTCSKSLKIILSGQLTDEITLSSDPSDKNTLTKYKKSTSIGPNGFAVYGAGIFTVVEVTGLGLQIKWDHGTRVYVKLGDQWKGKVSGLCGNYNGDAQDDMKTPSQGLETSSLLFGHSWKLQEFCSPPTEQIEACTEHPERKIWAHMKCGILKSEIFQACHSEVPIEKYLKRCIFDACACDKGGDCECLCTAIAAYAQECAVKGISIAWRTPEICPMQCDAHCSGYSSCVPACPLETCDNYLEQDLMQRMCVSEACVEGCSIKPCEEGQIYLNDSYTECVPKATCKPVCMKKNGKTYYEGDIIHSDECQTCRCSRKKEICSGAPCSYTTLPTVLTTEKPLSAEEFQCTEGWTDWSNVDTSNTQKTGVKTKRFSKVLKENDVEPIPKLLELLSMFGFGSCPSQFMDKIECRVVGTHESAEDTEDNAYCTLKKGLICIGPCHDYEIRVHCECASTTAVYDLTEATTKQSTCNAKNAFVEFPDDCYKFLHCEQQPDGSWDYEEKTCGPSMMFNPSSKKCDWKIEVQEVKPICKSAITEISTTTPITHAPMKLLGTTLAPKNICDPTIPHVEFSGDCFKFLHCEQKIDGSWDYVEKTCGPTMMFNSKSMTCDWPANVLLTKPECGTIGIESSTVKTSECPRGKKWSNCATPCGKACHYYEKTLYDKQMCKIYSSPCEEGCIDENLPTSCPEDKLWRDKKSCVEISDCPCMSHTGKFVKPHDIFKESDCEICQCLDNSYVCSKSDCKKEEEVFTRPSVEEIEVVRPSTEKPLIVPTIVTPPKMCESENLVYAINGESKLQDSAFSASSMLGSSFLPQFAKLNAKPTDISSGSWSPVVNDQTQYLQIAFPKATPLYGVIIQGSPIYDQYVTSFKILYSFDGDTFHYLNDESETPQLFNGPIDSRTPVETMFKIPIESLVIRIYPLKWHGGISMRVELLGCSLNKPEIPKLQTGTTPVGHSEASTETSVVTPKPEKIVKDEDILPLCDEPMGIDNGKISSEQVKASSIKPTVKGKTPNLLKLLKTSSKDGWRPTIDSPNEYIWLDFLEPRNITGFKTKGGPHGWVTAYNVLYSKNGYIWNTILIPDGTPKLYLANNDEDTPKINYFHYPIHAQYVKIVPIKWENCIEMKIEPLGCFKPYPVEDDQIIEAITIASIESIKDCPICPGVEALSNLPDGSSCKCEPPMFWNGKSCVDRSQCPCMVGHMPYEIGAQYESEDCMQCVCVLGGVPQCKPQKCPLCQDGLRRVKSTNCICLCEPCPEFQRLCPSSGDCIPEHLWCNGIQDCQDDELNCEKEETTTSKIAEIEEAFNITKTCPDPYCPPGMRLQTKDKRVERKMSPMFESSSKGFKKSSKLTMGKFEQMSKSSRKSSLNKIKLKASKKGSHSKKMKFPSPKIKANAPIEDECFEFICVPELRPTITKNHTQTIRCSEPECPENYDVKIEFTLDTKPNECAKYSCVPRPQKDAICLISGRSFKTFDSTEYKYEICSHILARDLIGDKWSISLNKNCSEGNFICRKQLIIKDKDADYILILQHDLSVKLNDFPYTVRQLENSPYTKSAFVISQPGNTILFVSKTHGFWLSYDKNGEVKIGVSSKYKKTVDGLCGYYNDIVDDDKRLPSGKSSESTAEFGDAWFNGEMPKESCKPHACPKELQEAAWKMCNTITDHTFNPCTGAVDRDRFVSKCLETTCDCLKSSDENLYQAKKKCKCSVLENFVKECLSVKPELEISTWRAIHNCEISCPTPLVYRDCYRRSCEPSCDNIKTESCPPLPNVCFSGCYCPEGTVRKGETCVSITDCMDCACDGFGKSKYLTYDRQNFTFEGNCTYLLSRDLSMPELHIFQVYVTLGNCEVSQQKPVKKTKTKLKQRSQQVARSSCTTAMHILHGDHIVHIQRAAKKKINIIINGIEADKFPFKNEWLHVRVEPGREILVSLTDSMVEISSAFADMSFTIRVPSVKYGSKMEGLCGDCNGYPNNDLQMNPKKQDLLTPGNSLKDIVESWQADEPKLGIDRNQICLSDDKPLDDCIPLPPEVDPCLKIWDEELFGQCHLLVDPMMYVSACQQDMCKPGADQKVACATLSAYAKDCSRHGVCLKWRNPQLCPLQCPPNLQFEPCGCPETCETIKTRQMFHVINVNTKSIIKSNEAEKTCSGEKIEGCFCSPGKVLNNGTCIPEEHCTQCDNGHYAGDTWLADKCTECECTKDGKTSCTKQECPIKEKICEEDSTSLEISKPEDCCPKFICVPRPTVPTPTTCPEAPVPSCGSDQVKTLKMGSDNCPQYICECKPISDCDILKPSKNLRAGEKIVTDTLGCCPVQKIECDKSLCPPKIDKCEKEFYEVIEYKNATECCIEFKCEPPKNVCLVVIDEVPSIKQLDEIWAVTGDPCTKKKCSYGPEGILVVVDQTEDCDLNCPRGFAYTVEPSKCCGKCVQTMCNDHDISYKPNEVWYSADNCTSFTCEIREDNFYIISTEETCPDLSECPTDQQYKEGCCTLCKLKPASQKNCLPELIPEKETIEIIKFYEDEHGYCVNQLAIQGLAECVGSCPSGSKFNAKTYGQDHVCQCCSATKYETIKVPLKCDDDYVLMKEIEVPSSCSCLAACGKKSHFDETSKKYM